MIFKISQSWLGHFKSGHFTWGQLKTGHLISGHFSSGHSKPLVWFLPAVAVVDCGFFVVESFCGLEVVVELLSWSWSSSSSSSFWFSWLFGFLPGGHFGSFGGFGGGGHGGHFFSAESGLACKPATKKEFSIISLFRVWS